MKEVDSLSWYARKASRSALPSPEVVDDDPGRADRVRALLSRLKAAGIKGNARSMTLFTRRLPPGCLLCLKGQGSNLYVTGHCTRDCFFCFNEKPRKDELVVHGIPVREPEEAPAIIERFDLKSVGISGGEPLLFPDRVLRLIRALRAMPRKLRIDLYTNGDRVDTILLQELRSAGLDALRFNLVAREFSLYPVRLALRYFEEVAVEIPVIPEQMPQLRGMVRDLDHMGVPFLNLHELFSCSENSGRVAAEGQKLKDAPSKHLLWRPTQASGEAALELLLYALENTRRLSVYYCSCGTQEMISRNGLIRRRRLKGSAA